MAKRFAILFSLIIFLTVSTVAQKQLKGIWTLVSMTDETGEDIQLPEKTTIILEFLKSTVRARVCNHLDGKYSVKRKKITIDFTRSTLMACPGKMEMESAFRRLMELTDSFGVANNGLTLSGKTGKPILKFTKMTTQTPIGLDGKWRLVSFVLADKKPIPLPGQPITLNIEKDKIGGNGGCNTYGGSVSQGGKTVKFSGILSTQMWCDNSPTEQLYFDAMEKSVWFELENGQLILTDAKKEQRLVFAPISYSAKNSP